MLKFAACPRNIGALPGKTPRVPAAGTHCRARQRWRRPVEKFPFLACPLGHFSENREFPPFCPKGRHNATVFSALPLCTVGSYTQLPQICPQAHPGKSPVFQGFQRQSVEKFPGFSTPVQNPPVKHNLLPARPAFSSWFPAARPAVSPTAWPRGYPDLRPRIQSTGWRQPGPAVKR